jgi:predicted MFS family arabinose efflux permease
MLCAGMNSSAVSASLIANCAAVKTGRDYFIPSLGIAQIISWGTLYYSFPLIAEAMAKDLGLTRSETYGAATIGLLVSSMSAYPIGVAIDRAHGRMVMSGGAILAALLLLGWSNIHSISILYAVFAGMGIAQSMTLYEPAFAVIAKRFRSGARRKITALTLWGGFASTLFVPVIQFLLFHMDWRDALLILAMINVAVGLLYYRLMDPDKDAADPDHARKANANGGFSFIRQAIRKKAFWGLLASFTVYYATFAGLSFHLYPLLLEMRIKPSAAITVIALLGPSQVVGRILVWMIAGQRSMPAVGKMIVLVLPLALISLLVLSPILGAITFVVLFGMANGIMTIVRGTSVPDMLSREAYGTINAALALPGTIAKAVAPFLVALFWDLSGSYVPVISAILLSSLLVVAGFCYAAGQAIK